MLQYPRVKNHRGRSVEKPAYYRRAQFTADGQTLETLIRQALVRCPEVADTKFSYKSNIAAQVAQRLVSSEHVGIFFTLFDEGSPAGTVQNGGSRLGKVKAPFGEEFIKTSIHLIVDENHVAYVATGRTNEGQITSLLRKWFDKCKFTGRDLDFEVMRWADRSKIDNFLKDGVQSIDLGVYAFEQDIAEINGDLKRGGIKDVERLLAFSLNSIFGKDLNATQIIAARDIKTKIHLGFDKRTSGHLTPSVMGKMAAEVVESADEFLIETVSGQKITAESIALKKTIIVAGDEDALDSESAFSELGKCISYWKSQGVL